MRGAVWRFETDKFGNPEKDKPIASVCASIHELRRHVLPEPAKKPDSSSPFWTFGIDKIDTCLPAEGISRAGLHEIEPLRPGDMPSLTGFAFGLLSRLQTSNPIIWCVTAQQVGDYGQLYAFGLERYGISPAQIVFAKVNHPLQLHFALEEALKTDGVAAVIGEGPRPNFIGSRRLSLLSKARKRPCLLLSSEADGGRGSAALTRWQISPDVGVEDPHDPFGPGLPTWRVALPRSRGGHTMPDIQDTQRNYPWRIVWDEQTLSFRPATLFSGGTVSQTTTREQHAASTLVGRTG